MADTMHAPMSDVDGRDRSRPGITLMRYNPGCLARVSTDSDTGTEFEYVVVGSGAGGGTLAARLAEAGCKVLLLEAGGDPPARGRGKVMDAGRDVCDDYEVPAFHTFASEHPAMRWDFFVRHYASDEQQRKDPKHVKIGTSPYILYPRAGTLGGCTAHHAMITVYPHNDDWDHIARLTGDESWRSTTCGVTSSGWRTVIIAPFRTGGWESLVSTVPATAGVAGCTRRKAIPKAALKDDRLVDTIRDAARVAMPMACANPLAVCGGSSGPGRPERLAPGARQCRRATLRAATPHATTRVSARASVSWLSGGENSMATTCTIELDALATRVILRRREPRRRRGVPKGRPAVWSAP